VNTNKEKNNERIIGKKTGTPKKWQSKNKRGEAQPRQIKNQGKKKT